MRDNEATSRTLGDIHDSAVEAGRDGIDAIKGELAGDTGPTNAATVMYCASLMGVNSDDLLAWVTS